MSPTLNNKYFLDKLNACEIDFEDSPMKVPPTKILNSYLISNITKSKLNVNNADGERNSTEKKNNSEDDDDDDDDDEVKDNSSNYSYKSNEEYPRPLIYDDETDIYLYHQSNLTTNQLLPCSYKDFICIDEGVANCKFVRPSAMKFLCQDQKVLKMNVPYGYVINFDPILNQAKEKPLKEFSFKNLSLICCKACGAVMSPQNLLGKTYDIFYEMQCIICHYQTKISKQNISALENKEFEFFYKKSLKRGVFDIKLSERPLSLFPTKNQPQLTQNTIMSPDSNLTPTKAYFPTSPLDLVRQDLVRKASSISAPVTSNKKPVKQKIPKYFMYVIEFLPMILCPSRLRILQQTIVSAVSNLPPDYYVAICSISYNKFCYYKLYEVLDEKNEMVYTQKLIEIPWKDSDDFFIPDYEDNVFMNFGIFNEEVKQYFVEMIMYKWTSGQIEDASETDEKTKSGKSKIPKILNFEFFKFQAGEDYFVNQRFKKVVYLCASDNIYNQDLVEYNIMDYSKKVDDLLYKLYDNNICLSIVCLVGCNLRNIQKFCHNSGGAVEFHADFYQKCDQISTEWLKDDFEDDSEKSDGDDNDEKPEYFDMANSNNWIHQELRYSQQKIMLSFKLIEVVIQFRVSRQCKTFKLQLNESKEIENHFDQIRLAYLKYDYNVALEIQEFNQIKSTEKQFVLQAQIYHTDEFGDYKCRVINYFNPYTDCVYEFYDLLDSDAVQALMLRSSLSLVKTKSVKYVQDYLLRQLLNILCLYLNKIHKKEKNVSDLSNNDNINYCPLSLDLLTIYIYSALKKDIYRKYWDDKDGIVYNEYISFLNWNLYQLTTYLYPRLVLINSRTNLKTVGKKGVDRNHLPTTRPLSSTFLIDGGIGLIDDGKCFKLFFMGGIDKLGEEYRKGIYELFNVKNAKKFDQVVYLNDWEKIDEKLDNGIKILKACRMFCYGGIEEAVKPLYQVKDMDEIELIVKLEDVDESKNVCSWEKFINWVIDYLTKRYKLTVQIKDEKKSD